MLQNLTQYRLLLSDYLVDFGSVQTLAATEGRTITVVGTYGYMPPEQFGGRAVPASDLYSLGATLIYLVTGTHPADCYAFVRVRLRINQQKFFLTYEPFPFKWYRNQKNVQGLRQGIGQIEYIKRSSTKGSRGKPQSRIIIWIEGTQSFTIGDIGRITEPELDWLAYELSDWLGMPIIRE